LHEYKSVFNPLKLFSAFIRLIRGNPRSILFCNTTLYLSDYLKRFVWEILK
jgi:hypothetical protein